MGFYQPAISMPVTLAPLSCLRRPPVLSGRFWRQSHQERAWENQAEKEAINRNGVQKMWNILKSIKKFTPKSELDKIIGAPLFQIEDRPAYYYGKGIVVFYSPKSFMIQGIQRIEYGEPGEWAVGMYHFPDIAVLKAEFGLIWKWAQKNPADYQTEGVTNRLVDGQMAFNNLFIIYGQYQFFFYGKSQKTKLSCFQFSFNE